MRRVFCTNLVLAPWWSSHRPSRVYRHVSHKVALCSWLCWSSHPLRTPFSSSSPPSFPHPPTTLIRALSPSRIHPRCRQCRTSHPPCRQSARESLSLQTVSPATALLPGHQSNSLSFHFLGWGFWRMNERTKDRGGVQRKLADVDLPDFRWRVASCRFA